MAKIFKLSQDSPYTTGNMILDCNNWVLILTVTVASINANISSLTQSLVECRNSLG